ncbi:RHS repeat domain-containing protein [Streptomyces sp. NPDC058953]
MLSVTDAAGRRTSTAHTPAGAGVPTKTVVTNPKNHNVTTFLDGLRGLPLRTYDANAKKTEQTYDALGRATGVWLPNRSKDAGQSASTSFAYTVKRGAAPSVATSTIKSSTTVTTSYEIFDSLLRPLQKQVPTPLGGRLLTDTRYDSRGQAYETYAGIYDTTKAPNGTYTRAEFGQAPKQLHTVFDGAGRATTSSFLVFGTKRWETATTYTGDSTATTAPTGGQAVRVVTDAQGQTVQRREYAGTSPADADFGGGLGSGYTTTGFTYTRDGKQATVTGPDGGQWHYGYDLFGRRTSESDPDKGTTRSGYTPLDQADWTKNAENGQILFGYDELGRKSGLWSGAERTDATKVAAWTYDTLAKGQPDGSVRYDGGVAGKAYGKKIVSYDTLYRPLQTQLTVDATDPLVVAGAAAASYSFSTSYNLDGTIGSATEPAAGGLASEIVSYRYTQTGQPIGVSGTSDYLLDVSYSAQGQPQQLIFGVSGATEAKKTYIDNRYEQGTDRLIRSFVTTPQTAPYKPQDLSYSYDDAGNVTKIADTPNASPTLKTDVQCFSYDGRRRLTEAWTPATDDCGSRVLGGAAPYRTSFTYNGAGQRATETRTPVTGAPATTTYCYQDPERRHALTRTTTAAECGAPTGEAMYAYDKTGNTVKRPAPDSGTQELTWNTEGKLSQLAQGTRKSGYLYDADGTLLIRRAVTGDGTSVLYVGATEIHHKVSGTTKTTWATRSYSVGGTSIALRSTESGTSGVSFLAGDRHGTAGLALDATTQAVSKRFTTPFGSPRGTAVGTWPDDKRFLGKAVDTATGLTHVGARQYDPAIGQFISVDPLMELDKHQTLNGYSYGAQNPATFADPSGLGLACGNGPNDSACPTQTKPNGKKVPGNGRPNEGVNKSKSRSSSSSSSGTHTDTSSDGQPVVGGVRVPEFKEMSVYAAAYADLDTYGYRMEKWAKNICHGTGGGGSGYADFCSIAKSSGLLEVPDDPLGVAQVGRCVLKGKNCGEAAVVAALYLVGAGWEWSTARLAAGRTVKGCGCAGAHEGIKVGEYFLYKAASSVFTPSGRLTQEALDSSSMIQPGSKMDNHVVQDAFAVRGGAEQWGKYKTPSYQSPYGNFSVHFYKNSTTDEVLYDLDYKVVMNDRGKKKD